MDAVQQRFWDAGYAGTSMEDLMRVSGLGKGSLYAAFGGKRQLFLRVLCSYTESSHEHLRRALTQAPRAIDALRMLLEPPMEEPSESGARRGCLLANSTCELGNADADVLAFAHQAYETSTELIAECVSRAQDEGDLQTGSDVVEVARSLLAAQQGIMFMSRTGMSAEALDATSRSLTAHLLPTDSSDKHTFPA